MNRGDRPQLLGPHLCRALLVFGRRRSTFPWHLNSLRPVTILSWFSIRKMRGNSIFRRLRQAEAEPTYDAPNPTPVPYLNGEQPYPWHDFNLPHTVIDPENNAIRADRSLPYKEPRYLETVSVGLLLVTVSTFMVNR